MLAAGRQHEVKSGLDREYLLYLISARTKFSLRYTVKKSESVERLSISILMITVALKSDTKCPKNQIHCIVKPQLETQTNPRVKMGTPKSNFIVPALQPQMAVVPRPGIPLKLPVTLEKKKPNKQRSPAKTGTLSGK